MTAASVAGTAGGGGGYSDSASVSGAWHAKACGSSSGVGGGDEGRVVFSSCAWRRAALEQELLLASPQPASCSTAAAECGVSLGYLRRLVELSRSMTSCDDDFSVRDFVASVVLPLTRARKSRFFDLIPPKWTGKPRRGIVYASSVDMGTLLDQLAKGLEDDGVIEVTTRVSSSTIQQDATDDYHVWFDVVAADQHPGLHRSSADPSLVKGVAKACSDGVAVILDPELTVLTRLWAMYETWSYVHCGHVKRIWVVMSHDTGIQDLLRFEAKVRTVDIARCEARLADDRTYLLSEIKASVGMQKMLRTLQDSLLLSVRSGLRWSCDLHKMGLYSGLLLSNGELSQLQQVLHSIPELQDDEKMLREVQDVFMTYVSSADDELDETQFAQVLVASGFEEKEAHSIYHQVNSDDGPGVGLEEFKEWWVKTQREAVGMRAPLQLTAKALEDNIVRMAAVMQREEETELAVLFNEYIKGIREGKFLKPGTMLPPSALKGDWQSIADTVAWQLHVHEFRDAAVALYDMLMWNGDAMSTNPIELPLPKHCQDAPTLFRLLADYLQEFGTMLAFQASCRQHGQYFQKFSEELQNARVRTLLAEQISHSASFQMPPSQQKLNHERFHVVRSMISLKYGNQQPVGHSLIVEAEKSLASWMAGNRQEKGKVSGDVRGGLSNLAHDYFRSRSQAEDGSVLKVRPRANPIGFVTKDRGNASVLSSLGPEALAYLEEIEKAKSDEDKDNAPKASSATSTLDDIERMLIRQPLKARSYLDLLDKDNAPPCARPPALDATGGGSGGRGRGGEGTNATAFPRKNLSEIVGGSGAFGTVQGGLQRVRRVKTVSLMQLVPEGGRTALPPLGKRHASRSAGGSTEASDSDQVCARTSRGGALEPDDSVDATPGKAADAGVLTGPVPRATALAPLSGSLEATSAVERLRARGMHRATTDNPVASISAEGSATSAVGSLASRQPRFTLARLSDTSAVLKQTDSVDVKQTGSADVKQTTGRTSPAAMVHMASRLGDPAPRLPPVGGGGGRLQGIEEPPRRRGLFAQMQRGAGGGAQATQGRCEGGGTRSSAPGGMTRLGMLPAIRKRGAL